MNTASVLTRRAAALLAVVVSFPVLGQQEVGYIEDFALAEDREAALKQLIPGTDDYYYYHALHHQNAGQRDALNEVLGQWRKRFKSSSLREVIERRQALLDYERNPEASLEFIRREIGLNFNHQQEGKARAQNHPQKLDQKLVSWEAFLEQSRSGTDSLGGVSNAAFHRLLAGDHQLTAIERRELLSQARMPDLPGLVKLIAADLATKESRGFGEFKIHGLLTLAQLDELRGLREDLLRNETYVHTYLTKLRPGADDDPAVNVAAREAYLERAWGFVEDLDPVFNSLKAHLLYQRLQHDRSVGVWNRGRFLEYVKLPRNVSYIRTDWRKEAQDVWKHPADPNRNFAGVTGLPPIGSDQALVRDYLLHFLKDADGVEPYAAYISNGWLQAVLAEAKIVNGIGDPERWTSMLSPAAFQALKDRVDLDFDPAHRAVPDQKGNPVANADTVGVEEEVRLRLHVKNVPKLIVKVFELNPLNYYLEHGRELSTDVSLDGLVPNHERTVEYAEPPARRVARDFTFPEIGKTRGVWVVEFIGGGQSSRAVIRKGHLEALTETTARGVQVTVLGEDHKPLPDAAVWFGDRRVRCDEKGRALIPFSSDPGQRTLVLEDGGGFASLAQFVHPAENYELTAGIHVPRESLRSGAMATLAVRPTLKVGGEPISLSLLSDVTLTLRAVDLDGIVSTTTVEDFEIFSDREATHEFRVPDRLASLAVTLEGTVKMTSQFGEDHRLSTGAGFDINDQLRSEEVDGLFLSRIGGSYVLEYLGRTGESRRGHNIVVQFRRPGFSQTRNTTLKTNEAGMIDLGVLEGIAGLSARTPDGRDHSWGLNDEWRSQPSAVHAQVGEPVRVPYLGKLDRSEVALLSMVAGTYEADHYGKLKLENGFLVAGGLAAGDYQLHLKESGQTVTLRIAAGEASVGRVFNAARSLELSDRAPAHLTELEAAKDTVALTVANADELTRVHVVATRFLPTYSLYGRLGQSPQPGLNHGQAAYLPNLFISGRKIGDEFRYILERRYAQKFPGNMLERPEILLNPWAVRETESEEEELDAGGTFGRELTGRGKGGAADGATDPFAAGGAAGVDQSLDFLRHDPVTLWNLRPDKKGKITIKRDAFGDRQHVHVLVVDPSGATYRQLSLNDRGTEVKDLRLLDALDPDKHYTEQDAMTLMEKGDTLVIPDLLTARFEALDDLGAAHRYLLAVQDHPTLREFSFITTWPELKDEEKRARYSEFACHELSFFLQRKDPEFFKAVVLPHLRNKKDRTFMDDYLLGVDLGGYFEPYAYARLNVPERILLARTSKDRAEAIEQDLADRIALRPPNPEAETMLFEAALATFGMSGDRQALMDEARADVVTARRAAEGLLAVADEKAPAAPATPAPRAQLGKDKAAAKPEGAKKESLERLREVAEGEVERKYNRVERDGAVDPFAGAPADLPTLGAFFRAIEPTKEWAENNYYELPIEAQTYELITDNKFWLDFARHEGEGGFGSRHLGAAARSFSEAMLALAVLDLPFEAQEHQTKIEEARMDFTAGSRLLAFHREIKEAKVAVERPPLLVNQSYFRQDDRYRMENGQQVDKFVSGEFVAGVVYGGQVVVTNPTSSRQKIDVLVQIPKGAMPVLGKRATVTQRMTMEPYSTQRLETYFYFPTVGEYPCYPAHVSQGGEVIANAQPSSFTVVETPTVVDKTSWAYLSQWGSGEEVLGFLAKENLHAVNLGLIAWRCRESREFTVKALEILDRRGIYHETLFSYGIHHQLGAVAGQFLLMQERFLNGCGLYLQSPLVTVDPIERRAYEHLEYKPLVNNRAHRVGAEHRILNGQIREQYQTFLTILSQKPSLDAVDQLSTAYYLFLQDRVAEGLARLDAVDPAELPTRMQYDYFRAYAAFYRSKPEEARQIARRYTDYPVDRWQQRFAAILTQAEEITGADPEVHDEESREEQQEALASKDPALVMEVKGTEITLDYQNLASVQVNYYEMDLEFLFSTTPFVSSDGGGFAVVKPNRSDTVRLAKNKRTHTFQLPRDYQARNVLVEVVGGGKKRSQAVYANELQTVTSESYGILTVRHGKTGRPLPKVYVKVYALTDSGPTFYKDGYTDLRGKFDYATVSTTDIGKASKFSILVMSDEHGATVLEAPVPQR